MLERTSAATNSCESVSQYTCKPPYAISRATDFGGGARAYLKVFLFLGFESHSEMNEVVVVVCFFTVSLKLLSFLVFSYSVCNVHRTEDLRQPW